MRPLSVLVALVLLPASAAAQGAGATGDLVLAHVAVVDVRAGGVRPDQTIIVRGNRIAAVASASSVRVPAGARVVDATAKFVAPGLWDMHTHFFTSGTAGPFPLLYVANGGTGVRDLGTRVPLAEIARAKREIAAGTMVGPRLVWEARRAGQPWRPERRRYFPPAVRTQWEQDNIVGPPLPEFTAAGVKASDVRLRAVGDMHRAGVPLLTGTDLVVDTYPGFSVHEELELLVRAGLTPLEALRTATLNPARYLAATDSLGTVALGKVADLVLLDADPLADIRHTTRIAGVVLDGRYLDRRQLDDLLARAERAAATPP
jgi:predicted amidohydrolase YtcJ